MAVPSRVPIAGILLLSAALIAGDAHAFSVRTVDLKVRDLVYNRHDGLLYVSVPGYVPERGNTVTLIHPSTGELVASIPVGSEPNVLALSQDGSALYVGLDGASLVRRIDVATRTVELDIPLPTDMQFGPVFAGDLGVLPGAPHTFAVALRYTGISPSHAGVAVYDDAVQRPVRTPGHTGSDRITFGDRSDRLYGVNIGTTEYGYRRMQVDASGLTILSVTPDLIPGWQEFEWHAGRIYSNGGRVIDPEAATLLGTYPLTYDDYDRSVAPDSTVVYFVSNRHYASVTLSRFDADSFALLDRRQLRGAYESPWGATRWGAHGLAYFTFDYFSETGRVYILDGIDDPPNADLALSARDSGDPSTVGEYLTTTVTLRNLGSDDAPDARLETDFAGGYPLLYAQSSRGTCFESGGGRVCQFGTIMAGDSVTVSFTFQPMSEGQLVLHAVATSSVQDGDPANNEVTETTLIAPRPPEVDLYVVATVDSFVAAVGEPLTVVVDVRNRGAAEAAGALLDSRFGGSQFRVEAIENPLGACSPDPSTSGHRCELGTIAPGGQARVHIRVTPLETGYLYGSFEARSTATDSRPYDNITSIYLVIQPSPESLIDSLIARIELLSLRTGAVKSLLRPLEDARTATVAEDAAGACAAMLDFDDVLGKRVGRALSIPLAYSLLSQSATIREFMGCDGGIASGRGVQSRARTHSDVDAPAVAPATGSRAGFHIEANPSTSQSRLRFELPRAGRARLQVFDVRGRLVAVLADRAFPSGSHEVTWTGPTAPGVYFYRLEPEGQEPMTLRGVVLP